MIPELLNGTSHGFPKRVNSFLHLHNFWIVVSKEQYSVDAFLLLTLRPETPFSVNNINAIAQKG